MAGECVRAVKAAEVDHGAGASRAPERTRGPALLGAPPRWGATPFLLRRQLQETRTQPPHPSFTQLSRVGGDGPTVALAADPDPRLCLPLSDKLKSRNPATCFVGRAAVTGTARAHSVKAGTDWRVPAMW